jgi:C4-dicarboxylate-binding protein DctP
MGGGIMRSKLTVISCTVFLLIAVGLMPFKMTAVQSAHGEEIKLELTDTGPRGSCLVLAPDKVKEIVEKKSNGRIKIIRYPSYELYDPKAEIEAISKGKIAMANLHVSYVGGRSPALEFIGSFGAQGCWDDGDHYWRFIDLPEVRAIAEKEFRDKLNVKFLSMICGGNSFFGNTRRPVHTVEDFKGLKVRTAGVAQATMYKALGVVPTELSSKEVYMALQRGTIDGANSTPHRFLASKWYEVINYITQDYSVPWFSFWLAMNLDIWNKLSKGDQQIIQDAAREAEAFSRECAVKETEAAYEKLRAGLVKEIYLLPKSETRRITQIVKPVMVDLFTKRAGKEMSDTLWGLLDKTSK